MFSATQELADDVHWHGEDDGGVVLGGDAVQCLQVTELKDSNVFNEKSFLMRLRWFSRL